MVRWAHGSNQPLAVVLLPASPKSTRPDTSIGHLSREIQAVLWWGSTPPQLAVVDGVQSQGSEQMPERGLHQAEDVLALAAQHPAPWFPIPTQTMPVGVTVALVPMHRPSFQLTSA